MHTDSVKARRRTKRVGVSLPSDLIFWRDPLDWHRKLERLLADHLTPVLKRRLRTMNSHRFYDDDLSWLEEAYGDPTGSLLDEELALRLSSWRIRTFHACRPRNVADYLSRGLRCLRADDAIAELRRLISIHDRLARLRDESTLSTAVQAVGTDLREGRVFVGIDDRDLLDGAGHYLIYGSEYISAVLVRAGDFWFQDVLKLEGIPTVFVVDVPVSLLRGRDTRDFARLLLARWATNIARRRTVAPPEDFTFDIPRDIPPECIAGHHHPARIRDPLHQLELYRSATTLCPACSRVK
jgi:hypothetical protein